MGLVTDLCNRALRRIAGKSVRSEYEAQIAAGSWESLEGLTTAPQEAVECARFFAPTRDEILRLRPWGFATKTAAGLAALDAEHPRFSYVHVLPTDFLLLRGLYGGTDLGAQRGGEVCHASGMLAIASNVRAPILEYVYKADVATWPHDAVEVLVYKLAAALALPVSSNSGFMEINLQLFERALMLAIENDRTQKVGPPVSGEAWDEYNDVRGKGMI